MRFKRCMQSVSLAILIAIITAYLLLKVHPFFRLFLGTFYKKTAFGSKLAFFDELTVFCLFSRFLTKKAENSQNHRFSLKKP